MFEKLFKLKEHKTTARVEIIAGLTTFMTMAYILIVNPIILSDAGMDYNSVFLATALSAALATAVMALVANLPFALAPGMGLNAFFAYAVVLGMGYSWSTALAAVFVEGILFIILSIIGIREAVIKSIPDVIKKSVAVGIGVFISFIALVNGGIISKGEPVLTASYINSAPATLALIGIVLTAVLLLYKVKGALLIGLFATAILGIPFQATDISNFQIFAIPTASETIFKLDFTEILSSGFWVVVISFLFVDFFDTIGTLTGLASRTGHISADGKITKGKQALLADAIGTTFGSLMGTSTVTTYVESASGVQEGGKTGLTALTVAVLFFLSIFFAPLFGMVPAYATTPALFIVGMFMMKPILDIDFDDYTLTLPAFVTIIFIPFTYSIAEGLMFGIVSFSLVNIIKHGFKKEHMTTHILSSLLFIKIVTDYLY